MKKILLLTLLVLFSATIKPGIFQTHGTVPNQRCAHSLSNATMKFIYDNWLLCFIGLWVGTDSMLKALVGTMIASAIAHEYLNMYHIPHGSDIYFKDGTNMEISHNGQKIFITDAGEVIMQSECVS